MFPPVAGYAGATYFISAAERVVLNLRSLRNGPPFSDVFCRNAQTSVYFWMPAQVIADKLAPFVAAGLTAELM
jgi:hypothetical protein